MTFVFHMLLYFVQLTSDIIIFQESWFQNLVNCVLYLTGYYQNVDFYDFHSIINKFFVSFHSIPSKKFEHELSNYKNPNIKLKLKQMNIIFLFFNLLFFSVCTSWSGIEEHFFSDVLDKSILLIFYYFKQPTIF